jgi:hypothetical protein
MVHLFLTHPHYPRELAVRELAEVVMHLRIHLKVMRHLARELTLEELDLINHQNTPIIFYFLGSGDSEVIQWIISKAPPRELFSRKPHNDYYTCLDKIRKRGAPEIISLVEGYLARPEEVTSETRATLRHHLLDRAGLVAADIFALVIFHCDDLFALRD